MTNKFNRLETDPLFLEVLKGDPFRDRDRIVTDSKQLKIGSVIEMVMPLYLPKGLSERVLTPYINATLCVRAIDCALRPRKACEHMPEPNVDIIPGSVPPMIQKKDWIVYDNLTNDRHLRYAPDDPFRYRDDPVSELATGPHYIDSVDGTPRYPGLYFRFVVADNFPVEQP
jgi:hypothetical protein